MSATEEQMAEALRVGDYAFVAQYLREIDAYECVADHVERRKHWRKGVPDTEKERRDNEKALFKGYFDFLCKELKLNRSGEAFERATAKFPRIDEEVAWYVGPLSKDGAINRLAKKIHNPHVQHERENPRPM